jgi:hypothetical protein
MTVFRPATAVSVLALAATALAALTACSDPAGVSNLVVDSAVVASAGVTPAEGRTYEYDFGEVRPDSVLLALWRAGIQVETAWWPIAYRCEDARGPRLTVQLLSADDRMSAHDFTLGTGRLGCSEWLVQYVVSVHPG